MAMLAGGREYGYGIKQALEAEFRTDNRGKRLYQLTALLALLAGVLSVPLGIALYAAVYAASGGSSEDRVLPPWWWLVLVVVGVVALTSAAITLPARLATRVIVAKALRYE